MQKLDSVPKNIKNLYFHPKMDKDKPWGNIYIFKNKKLNTAILVYGVIEVRMCTEVGLFAIIKNLKKPKVQLNPKTVSASFAYEKTVIFFDPLPIAAMPISIYDKDTGFGGHPYFFFNLNENKVAFAKGQLAVHGLKKIGKYKIQTQGPRPTIHKRKEIIYTFDIRELEWFSFEKFDEVKKKFIEFHMPEFKRRVRIIKFRDFLEKFRLKNIMAKLKNLFFSDSLFMRQEMKLIHRIWGLRNYDKHKRGFRLVDNIFRKLRFVFRCILIISILSLTSYLINLN